jgi:hypothetical protein
MIALHLFIIVPNLLWKQGDQIGRISTQWVIVYFGQLLENYRSTPYIRAYFFMDK